MNTIKIILALTLGACFVGQTRADMDPEKVLTLAKNILSMLDTNSHSLSSQDEVLASYATLRKLLSREPALSYGDIDRSWISAVKKEAALVYLMEELDAGPSTPEQREFVRQACNRLKIQDKIRVITVPDEEDLVVDPLDEDEYVISVSGNPNPDIRMLSIYHELGHVTYKDYAEYLKAEPVVPVELLESIPFKKLSKQIKRYKELAKKALDSTTPLGHKVREVLSKTATFWIPPLDKAIYKEVLYRRNQDERVDIFAAEHMLDQNHLNPILQQIVDWVFSGYVVVYEDEDFRPSHFERALSLIGFLVDKGFDINHIFREWYSKGICSAEPGMSFVLEQESQGAQDVMRAYSAQKNHQG